MARLPASKRSSGRGIRVNAIRSRESVQNGEGHRDTGHMRVRAPGPSTPIDVASNSDGDEVAG